MSISPSYVDGLELRKKMICDDCKYRNRDESAWPCKNCTPDDRRFEAETDAEMLRRIELADKALSLPDLASPVLNRIRAEGMRMAADFVEPQRNDIPACGFEFAAAIRARAAELEKNYD